MPYTLQLGSHTNMLLRCTPSHHHRLPPTLLFSDVNAANSVIDAGRKLCVSIAVMLSFEVINVAMRHETCLQQQCGAWHRHNMLLKHDINAAPVPVAGSFCYSCSLSAPIRYKHRLATFYACHVRTYKIFTMGWAEVGYRWPLS